MLPFALGTFARYRPRPLFLWVLNPIYGPVNQVLGAADLPQPTWLANTWGARMGVVVLLAIRDTVVMLQASFVPAYLLTDGGPRNATLYLPLYIYDQAFEFFGFGYSAMVTLALIAITLTLVVAQVLLVRRWRLLR
jgi:multiple sugar transport system permease protein